MLHFLLGVALCLFIGERLVHYWGAYRLRRDVRRSLAPPPGGYDYTPISKQATEWCEYAARQAERSDARNQPPKPREPRDPYMIPVFTAMTLFWAVLFGYLAH